MKRYFKTFLIVSIFTSSSITFSQGLTEEWKLIYNDENSSIFIEPTKIVEYGNEISVWAIENFAESKVSKKDKKYSSIKTHYLFNKMKKRYAEIGVIYYDEKGGIVNRSSKSNFSTGPSAFMTPITSDKKIEIIYKEVISYLITGEILIVDETFNHNSDQQTAEVENFDNTINEDEIKSNQIIEKPSPSTIVVKEEIVDSNEEEIKDESITVSEESWNKIPQIEEKLEIKERPKYKLREKPEKNVLDNNIDIKLPKNVYHPNKEIALKNAIFTDGNLYCVQVSSWKTEAYAKRELNKLLKKGFSAFIVSVKPTNKRDIWHRVRVGYFDTLEEAIKVQRETRKK